MGKQGQLTLTANVPQLIVGPSNIRRYLGIKAKTSNTGKIYISPTRQEGITTSNAGVELSAGQSFNVPLVESMEDLLGNWSVVGDTTNDVCIFVELA